MNIYYSLQTHLQIQHLMYESPKNVKSRLLDKLVHLEQIIISDSLLTIITSAKMTESLLSDCVIKPPIIFVIQRSLKLTQLFG